MYYLQITALLSLHAYRLAVKRLESPITHRTVWFLAGPIILANLSVPLVGAVDTAVMGHLPGPQFIGAVALGSVIFTFLYWGFGFLRMGTTGFVARAYGADDQIAMERLILRVLFLALSLGLLVLLLARPLLALSFWLLQGTMQVEQLAESYAHIRIWSAPATLCVYVCTGVFIGLQKTRYVLILQLTLNLANILLDLIFVPGLGFGVEGVAWATLIAEYLAAGLGLRMLWPWLMPALQQPEWARLLAPEPMWVLLKSNGHLLIRTLCVVFAFSWFTAKSATLGELVLAANSILLHLQTFMSFGLDGFAHASESLTGEASGARSRRRFQQAVKMTTVWAGIVAVFFTVLYYIAGPWLLTLFSNQADVLMQAQEYLFWLVILPVISVWSYQLDGIFIGSGNTLEMRNAMVVSAATFVSMTWLMVPWLGNHGLFLSLVLFMVVRALTLMYYYRSTLPAPV